MSHEERTDNRLYYVDRVTNGRHVTLKRYWNQLSDAERALQIEAEARAAYCDLFIKHRKGAGGRMLAYVTGKTAIDTGNAIFGYGGWGTKVIARSREVCTDGKKGQMEYYTCDIAHLMPLNWSHR